MEGAVWVIVGQRTGTRAVHQVVNGKKRRRGARREIVLL